MLFGIVHVTGAVEDAARNTEQEAWQEQNAGGKEDKMMNNKKIHKTKQKKKRDEGRRMYEARCIPPGVVSASATGTFFPWRRYLYGVIARIMSKPVRTKINVTTTVDVVTAGAGRFGAIFWAKQRDVKRAAPALGA